MARTNIQVPVTSDLKAKVTRRAEELGFSSVQDVIRVFLTGFAANKYEMRIADSEENDEYLTLKQVKHLQKRIAEIKEAEAKGELYTSNSVDEMMDILLNTKID